MKGEDLGYNVKTWVHDRRLTRAESLFLGILWVDHVGKENKIPAKDLAVEYAFCMEGRRLDLDNPYDLPEIEQWKRDVRYLQTHLIEKHDEIPLFSKAGLDGGYWIAADETEVDEYYYPMQQRGVRGIRKAGRAKKTFVVEAVKQLAFDFDRIAGDDRPQAIAERAKTTAPEIVEVLIETMMQNPEQFAGKLERLREKYFSGGVLLGKDRLAEIRAKARELDGLVSGLGG